MVHEELKLQEAKTNQTNQQMKQKQKTIKK